MTDAIKKTTEYDVQTGFCDDCNSNRHFYRHKSGGEWFCQLCSWTNERGDLNESVERDRVE